MWGATIDAISDAEHKLISIRAPLCGVRLSLLFLFVNIFYFNPRTPMWGATCRSLYSLRVMPTFQSAHPYVGCDVSGDSGCPDDFRFQSAHPYVGCDIHRIQCLSSQRLFQSAHPYVGCDIQVAGCDFFDSNFNPRTPMWGATFRYSEYDHSCDYFNPRTPMWGATSDITTLQNGITISIRAPLCGVRQGR